MTEKIIARAAEAILIQEGDKIIKRRIAKGYRVPELDEKLRKLRTRQESKLLEKSSSLVSVPKVFKVDEKAKEIIMEFIEGKKLSENLDNLRDKKEIMEQVGAEMAKLHDTNIIHGDLTTSNMILAEKNENENQLNPQVLTSIKTSLKKSNELIKVKSIPNRVYIIDFGLGFISTRLEDKAVDIHLLKQALEAKHFQNWKELFESFLEGYNSRDKEKTLKQLEKVEARGRYKH